MITHVGQRVQLRYAPEHKGMVTQVTREGFTVLYDWPVYLPPRKRGERKQRYRYLPYQAANFMPEGFEEIRVVEDEVYDDGIEIPEEILRIYGSQLGE